MSMPRHHAVLAALLLLAPFGCAPSPGSAPVHHAYDRPAPADSRLVEPLLPQSIRHFALSPDRRRVAYAAEGTYPSELHVATLGGEARKVASLSPNIERLQWTADGQGLVYVDASDLEVPRLAPDGNLPSRATPAHRVMRLPVAGGEPEVLVSSEFRLFAEASPARNELFVARMETPNGGFWSAIRRIDLGTREQADVLSGATFAGFSISPDGRKLGVAPIDPAKGLSGEFQIVDAATGETTSLVGEAISSGNASWLPDGSGVITVSHVASTLTVRRIPLAGPPPEPKRFPLPPHPTNGAPQLEMISPDGRRIVAYYGDRNVVVSLETGEMKTLESFGYIRCWLDDRTLMGAYHGGQYAVAVPD